MRQAGLRRRADPPRRSSRSSSCDSMRTAPATPSLRRRTMSSSTSLPERWRWTAMWRLPCCCTSACLDAPVPEGRPSNEGRAMRRITRSCLLLLCATAIAQVGRSEAASPQTQRRPAPSTRSGSPRAQTVVEPARSAVSEVADAAMRGDRDAVRAALARKADVDATQIDGSTALHWAVERDDLDMADVLLRAGARVTARTREGVTPLQLAATNGNGVMIDRLLKA